MVGFFVLEIIKMSTQIKKRLTIEKDMAILFSYVVNRINSTITQKMCWRYCYTNRSRRKGIYHVKQINSYITEKLG